MNVFFLAQAHKSLTWVIMDEGLLNRLLLLLFNYKVTYHKRLLLKSGRPVAVVRCRPDSENCLAEVPLVALHDKLVCTTDQVDTVGAIELLHNVTAKQIAGTSRGHAPALRVYINDTTD